MTEPKNSDLAELTAQARRAEYVEVAAGVSHELANALSAITGWSRVAEERLARGESAADVVALIGRAAKNAQRTARHLLALARGESLDTKETLNVTLYASDVAHLLEPKGHKGQVLIRTDFEEEAWTSAGSVDLLTVLWNLIQNAIEASPPHGLVTASVKRRGAHIAFVVRDRGPGIPGDMRARIFEPYFTTKSTGTGLGLALVKGALDRMGAEISIEVPADGGTEVTVLFPTVTAPTPILAPRLSMIPGEMRILIVDDDPGIQGLLATVLAGTGRVVTSKATAAEALALTDRFDAALIDLGLRDMRGDELVAELRKRGTITRAGLMSGASAPGHFFAGGEPDLWVRKPFELEDIRTALTQLLSE